MFQAPTVKILYWDTDFLSNDESALHDPVFAAMRPLAAARRLIEFLLPGSLTFLRYLLAIPVWPMLLVYLEAFFETLPFWREKEGATIHRQETSEALWVSPVAWLSVKSPAFAFSAGENIEKFFDERSWLSLVMWLIAPHLVWTIAATLRTVLFGTCMKCAEHLPCSRSHDATDSQERRKRSWGFHFTVQESLTLYDWRAKEDYKFHKWSVRAQGLLGLGLTRAISTVLWAPVLGVGLVFAVSLSAARELGPHRKVCVEQELAFLYAHAAWWAIVGSVHFARRRDGESVSQQSVDDVEMQSPAAGATVADGDDIDLVAPCHGSGIKESTGDYSTTGPKRKTSDVMPDIQELAKPGELGDEDDVHGTRAVDSSRDEEATASYSSRSGDSAHSSAHHGEQTTSCDKSEETAEPRSRTPSWRDAVQAAASAPNYTNDDDNRGNLSYSSDDVDIEAVDGSMLHNREFDLAAAPQHGSSATFVPRSSSSPSRDVGVTTMAVRLPNEAGAAATATPPTDGMEAPPTAVRFAESAGTDAGAEAPAAVRFADSVEAPPTTVQFADGVSADNGAEAPTAVRFADDTTEATRFNNPSGNAEVPATATRPSVRVAAPQQSSRPPRARAPYSPRDAEATSPYSTRDGMEAAAALPITAGHDMTISCPSDDLDETASYSSRNLEPTPHFSPRDFGPTFSSFSRSVETRVMSPDPADFRPPSRSPVRGAETEEEFNSLRRSQPTAEYFSDDDAGSRVADSHV